MWNMLRPLFLALVLAPCALAQSTNSATQSTNSNSASLPSGVEQWNLKFAGYDREALVYLPPGDTNIPAPVVFVFHGHGGHSSNVLNSFAINRLWPEAISVYPQGLNTPGRLTDPEGKFPGWQKSGGDRNDRDLKFFDALLARLQKTRKIDTNHIYATGHSNGGGFTYVLWAERGDVLAAVAPVAAISPESLIKLKPKPVMHIAGKEDPLVRFDWQFQTMMAIRKINHCTPVGTPWADNCTLYESNLGDPVITYIHPGKHELPRPAPPLIVKFFKEHSLKAN